MNLLLRISVSRLKELCVNFFFFLQILTRCENVCDEDTRPGAQGDGGKLSWCGVSWTTVGGLMGDSPVFEDRRKSLPQMLRQALREDVRLGV